MKDQDMQLLVGMMRDIIFKDRYNKTDAVMLLNWALDHKSAPVYTNKNGFLSLSYCGRCSTIVCKGDQFCSQCGRELRW